MMPGERPKRETGAARSDVQPRAGSEAMIDALRASGPRPELARKLALFGQFVGTWDVDVVNMSPDGTSTSFKAEWRFGWALGGRAVMDVWSAPGYEHGVSVRFYDESIDAWRSTWIGPVRRIVRPFIARQSGSEIVLEGSFAPGTLTRWIFSNIEERSFAWRNIESQDGGATWTTVQRMEAVRRS